MNQAQNDGFPAYLTTSDKGIYIRIHAQPAARKEGFRGLHGEAIKLAVRAAPQDGKANTSIVSFLAQTIGVKKSDVSIVSGHQSRSKRVFIKGNPENLQQYLLQLISK